MERLIAVEVYMKEVELWFQLYELSHGPTRRRIYLISDEPKVVKCRQKYSEDILDFRFWRKFEENIHSI